MGTGKMVKFKLFAESTFADTIYIVSYRASEFHFSLK